MQHSWSHRQEQPKRIFYPVTGRRMREENEVSPPHEFAPGVPAKVGITNSNQRFAVGGLGSSAGFGSQFVEPAAIGAVLASLSLVNGVGKAAAFAKASTARFGGSPKALLRPTMGARILWQLRPNPSFKPSPNGVSRGPGRRYAVHFRQPGPRATPLVPS